MVNDQSIFNTSEIPVNFAEGKLFHPTDSSGRLVRIDTIPKGSRVLDIGTGNGDLVEKMRDLGLRAYGIDITKKGLPQKPDFVALSQNLPFADNSFDYVVNNWGGITYPLHYADYYKDKPEIQNKIAETFLEQLKEAIRVSSTEIRIQPWAPVPFFELTNMLSLDSTNFLAINFKRLFRDMNIEWTLGEITGTGAYSEGLRYQTINLEKTENTKMRPLEDIISDIKKGKKKAFINRNDLGKISRHLPKLLDSIGSSQGSIFAFNDRIARFTKAIEEGNYKDVYTNSFDDQRAEKNGIKLKNLAKKELAEVLIDFDQYDLNRMEMYLDAEKSEILEYKKDILAQCLN